MRRIKVLVLLKIKNIYWKLQIFQKFKKDFLILRYLQLKNELPLLFGGGLISVIKDKIIHTEIHWKYCIVLWPCKYHQVDTNKSRKHTSLNATPTCLRACSGRMWAHVIISSLNLIWSMHPDGWGEELHPAGCRPQAAVTHSVWSLQKLVMRPAKSFVSCLSKASVHQHTNTLWGWLPQAVKIWQVYKSSYWAGLFPPTATCLHREAQNKDNGYGFEWSSDFHGGVSASVRGV